MWKKIMIFTWLLIVCSCTSDREHSHSSEQAHSHPADQSGANTGGEEHKSVAFDFQRIKSAAEEGVRNFNPGFVRSFHAARYYTIRDYRIFDSLVVVPNEKRPFVKNVAGEIPEQTSTGSFTVTFLDAKDQTVYKYKMESPLYMRVEHGPDKGLFKVRSGSFMVPLPPSKNIARIVLRDDDGTEFASEF